MSREMAKKAAGYAATSFVEEGMILGLGTGSTAAFFVERLGKLCREGLKISAIATSLETEKLAHQAGINLVDINAISFLDLPVDGADEIDPNKYMIKGGGGALLREKIVASMSREVIIVVDEAKCVNRLGKFPLATEIVPFAFSSTIHRIEQLGYQGKLRIDSMGKPYITDNGNYIFDIHFKDFIKSPEKLYHQLREVVGVIELGLFLQTANRVVIGHDDGKVEIRS